MMYYIRAARVHNLGERMIQKVHGENKDYGFGVIGYVAALLTTFSSIPRIFRVCRLRETRDISLWTTSALSAGILLWFIHGLMIGDLPVMFANCVFPLPSAFTCCFVLKNS